MKIDVVSDLHIDHWKTSGKLWQFQSTEARGRVLVIAGDSANNKIGLFNVLNSSRDLYENIVIVDGNHEHYNSLETVDEFCKDVDKVIKRSYPNVTFLNDTNVLKIDEIAIVGCNGWYDWKIMEPEYNIETSFNYWRQCMNDSRCILYDMLHYDMFNFGPAQLAAKQAKELEDMVHKLQEDESVKSIVCVTHTAPLKQMLRIKNDVRWDSLTASFGNSEMHRVIEADLNRKIKLWCFGHTHENCDEVVNGIRFVNNSRGYPSERRFGNDWQIKQVEIS